tara:strand:- start:572 stop:1510 length:939 start_codon:yes stop_codon:yes gene_type:complete
MNFNSLIIGMGSIGFKYDNSLNKSYKITHLSSQQDIKKINTIYCLDKKKFDIKKKHKVSKISGSLNILKKYKKHNINLITISTPTTTHFKILRKVLTYLNPKIILLEKPGTKKFYNLLELQKKCNQKQIALFCNYYRNFNKFYLNIKKYIEEDHNEIIINYSDNIYVNLPHFLSFINLFSEGKYTLKILNKSKQKKKYKINEILIEFKNCKIYLLHNQNGVNEMRIENKKFSIITSENFNSYVLMKKRKSSIFKTKTCIKESKIFSNTHLRNYQKIVYDKILKNFKNKVYVTKLNQNYLKTLKILNLIEKQL